MRTQFGNSAELVTDSVQEVAWMKDFSQAGRNLHSHQLTHILSRKLEAA